MIPKKIAELIRGREFLYVATSDLNGRPNVAPKFMLRLEGNFIYLADFIVGKTWENLKNNPRVSLSFMNIDNLTGYQINGAVEILSQGEQFNSIISEFKEKEISLTASRIIEGVQKGKKYENFEVAFPDRAVILKIKAEELVEIGHTGKLSRESVSS